MENLELTRSRLYEQLGSRPKAHFSQNYTHYALDASPLLKNTQNCEKLPPRKFPARTCTRHDSLYALRPLWAGLEPAQPLVGWAGAQTHHTPR